MYKKDLFKDWKYNGIHSLISWGASVVIIGLMFKILHWKFGDYMIALGLITEAILFFILGFQRDEDNGETTSGPGSFGIPEVQLEADTSAKIEQGLKNFADKVATISNAADTSLASADFADKLKIAATHYEKLGQTFETANHHLSQMTGSLKEFADSVEETKQFKSELAQLNKNLAALNSLYANMLTAMNQARN